MFIVHTQTLENYGAHAESGKHADGFSHWKFKGGDTYLVEDLDRPADAMAFVAAMCMENNIAWKEYPCEIRAYDEWLNDLPDDAGEPQSSRDYYISVLKRVTPNN